MSSSIPLRSPLGYLFEAFMMKRTFAVMALLVPACCIAQGRLATPGSVGSQCVGMNCPGAEGQQSNPQQTPPQPTTPQRPNLTPPGGGALSGSERQQLEQQMQ